MQPTQLLTHQTDWVREFAKYFSSKKEVQIENVTKTCFLCILNEKTWFPMKINRFEILIFPKTDNLDWELLIRNPIIGTFKFYSNNSIEIIQQIEQVLTSVQLTKKIFLFIIIGFLTLVLTTILL